MAYRWERASGGEIPADAYVKGHGYGVEDDEPYGRPLWLARTLPDENGAVRLGNVERGQPARFGKDHVDEYEVLLDRGTWKPEDGEDSTPPPDRVVLGHNAEGSSLYAAVSDEEQWGYWPRQTEEGGSSSWSRWHLFEPEEPEPGPYQWEDRYDEEADDREADAPNKAAREARKAAEAAKRAAEKASVVVSALDLRNEVVVITNTGKEPIGLSYWSLRDTSNRRPYRFPHDTILAPGGSIRVRSGPGASQPEPEDLVWTTAKVWNDAGDVAYLVYRDGDVVSTRQG